MSSKFTDFNLNVDSYAAFDATSLRDLIVTRLKDQDVFTDQVYEGSNLSSMIDIISYAYHVLLYYLNKTSSESMFSDTVLYENMNRVVKLLNYKPGGYKTSVVSFQAVATSALANAPYTIPRYSFVDVDGIFYSLTKDLHFTKTGDGSFDLQTDSSDYLLYQGKYMEYDQYTASGIDFETVTLSIGPDALIDHTAMDVYIYSASDQKYTQWFETDSLFIEDNTSKSYELRLNENYLYEFRFGNGINGKALSNGDRVCIYYLASDGGEGIISKNKLTGRSFSVFSTQKFASIKTDITSGLEDAGSTGVNYMTPNNIINIALDNDTTSTDPQSYETVDEIRANAPAYFATQNRLITAKDFETHISAQYNNIISDVKAVNNSGYINSHMRYMVDSLSLDTPILESRMLANHVAFANTTTFNNVYIYVVPRLDVGASTSKHINFLNAAQKQYIRSGIDSIKGMNLEPVFVDPVYMAVDICTPLPGTAVTADIRTQSSLKIYRAASTPRSKDQIKQQVSDIIVNYFKHGNTKLGQTVSVSDIYSKITSIPGVESVSTVNSSTETTGLSILLWNPVYSTDVAIHNQDILLPDYKIPYLYDSERLIDRINVV